jgi:precorrin-2 dehydrogenase / sirohydrochlorin ferrochelatase
VSRPPRYPVNVDLADASVLVVGAGPVAARKVDGLLECGARVTVVAPDAVPELQNRPGVRWHQREYRRGEVASYRLAISATNRRDVDLQVSTDAQASGIPVNVADVPELCTFTLPSILRRGNLQIAVSTNGTSPAFAGWIRRRLEQQIETAWAQALDVVSEVRDQLRTEGLPTEIPGWHDAFDAGFVDLVAQGRFDDAKALLRDHLGIDTAA